MTENSFSIDKNNKKKKELWELNKTPYERFKINSKIAWRRFDTQTRGMGLILLLIFGIVLISPIISLIGNAINDYTNKNKYKEALATACLDKQFYAFHFEDCEDQGVRPQ